MHAQLWLTLEVRAKRRQELTAHTNRNGGWNTSDCGNTLRRLCDCEERSTSTPSITCEQNRVRE